MLKVQSHGIWCFNRLSPKDRIPSKWLFLAYKWCLYRFLSLVQERWPPQLWWSCPNAHRQVCHVLLKHPRFKVVTAQDTPSIGYWDWDSGAISQPLTRWWFHKFSMFTHNFGEDEPIWLAHFFQLGSNLNHQRVDGRKLYGKSGASVEIRQLVQDFVECAGFCWTSFSCIHILSAFIICWPMICERWDFRCVQF